MRIIKKYSNRRLYDTSASGYVNLEGLAQLIREGEIVQVLDARSGEDISRQILIQVILETQGALDLMPVGLLHRMIRMGSAGPMVSAFRKQIATGLDLLDSQIVRMEQQFQWMRPGTTARPGGTSSPPPDEMNPQDIAEETREEVDELRARLAALEERLKK